MDHYFSRHRLFDEVDKPESSRTVFDDNGNGIAQREKAVGQDKSENSAHFQLSLKKI